MKVTVSHDELSVGSNKLIVRDATDGENIETSAGKHPYPIKVVDADNPKVQRGIREETLEVVGRVN